MEVPSGKITEQAWYTNMTAGIQHIASWLDGRDVTRELVESLIDKEMGSLYSEVAALFRHLVSEEKFAEFLTLPAYDQLIKGGNE
ncbi:hypothetical protein [Lentibacillus cibarius]|nr:hypothetical protein [Lentibacillus cibarius]